MGDAFNRFPEFGGLLFTGRLTGEFIALDEATGETLWEFKTGSSINSTAITYTHEGVQYVTVASGLGGILANRYAAECERNLVGN